MVKVKVKVILCHIKIKLLGSITSLFVIRNAGRQTDRRMGRRASAGGRTDGGTDRQTNGQTDGQMDGRMDGRTDRKTYRDRNVKQTADRQTTSVETRIKALFVIREHQPLLNMNNILPRLYLKEKYIPV